jgi:hypothetical protein
MQISLTREKSPCISNQCCWTRKHRKSLSHKKKAHVLAINAVKQEKHRKSLSPEKKAHVLAINAAKQEKHCKSLLPEKQRTTEEQIFSEWYDTRHWRTQKIISPNLIGGKTIHTNNTIQHTKETLWKTIIHSPFLQPTCSKCNL